MQIVPWMVWEGPNWDRATENISPHHHSGSPEQIFFSDTENAWSWLEMRSAQNCESVWIA